MSTKEEKGEKKKCDPEGIRTLNLLIRSQTPYPLGHEAEATINGIHYKFIWLKPRMQLQVISKTSPAYRTSRGSRIPFAVLV